MLFFKIFVIPIYNPLSFYFSKPILLQLASQFDSFHVSQSICSQPNVKCNQYFDLHLWVLFYKVDFKVTCNYEYIVNCWNFNTLAEYSYTTKSNNYIKNFLNLLNFRYDIFPAGSNLQTTCTYNTTLSGIWSTPSGICVISTSMWLIDRLFKVRVYCRFELC